MKKLSFKQRILTLSVAAIIAALSAYGSIAYFTAQDNAQNVITAGNVKIELRQKTVSPDGETIVPPGDQLGVMPGGEVSKIVEVKNTGSKEAWVRVSVDKAIELAYGAEGDEDLSLVTFDLNTEYWTEKDGFYYYTKPLPSGQITEPLFTTVSFDKMMGNQYQNSKAILTLNAYATQSVHNGGTVFEAAGWPETN